MSAQDNWLAHLKALVDREAPGDKKRPGIRAVATRAGLSEEYVYQLYADKPNKDGSPRKVGLDAAKAIARAFADGRDPSWFDVPITAASSPDPQGAPKRVVAHPMRLVPSDDPPRLNWGEILSSTEERFSVQIPDDAMAPRIAAGTWVRFMRTSEARPGDGILVRDRADNLYFRVMRQRTPGHWLAVSDNTNFDPLDSLADGLQVVGVLIGVDQRWG